MSNTQVSIQLADKAQFERFGIFLAGNQIAFPIPEDGKLLYSCMLDEYQLMIAKTQFKSIIIEQ